MFATTATAFVPSAPLGRRPAATRLGTSSFAAHTPTNVPLLARRRVKPAAPSAPRMVSAPPSSSPNEVVVISSPTAQKTPAATFQAAVAAGAAKAALPAGRVLLLGVLAGAYIALGGLLALSVGGSVPLLKTAYPGVQRVLFGLVGLPTGLLLVLCAGGELFTGNTALVTAAVLSGRASLSGLVRNWVWSYGGNLLGSLLVVKLALLGGALAVGGTGVGAGAMAVAAAKTSMPFGVAFVKGVLCNWLVCLAVYLANGAGDLASKFTAVVLPISAFVAMGMEHSVANMFLIPAGMAAGAAGVSVKAFVVGNLVPVTLGNVFAGVVLVAGAYFLAYGKK